MFLKSILYTEHQGLPTYWKLNKFDLNLISLFVAKNATGKTRTLNVTTALINLISGTNKGLFDGNWEAEIVDDNDLYTYRLDIINGCVNQEFLSVNNKILIERSANVSCKIWYEKLAESVDTELPENILAISRRDRIQHPNLEKISEWARNSYNFIFSSSMGREQATIFVEGSDSNPTSLAEASLGSVLKQSHALFKEEFDLLLKEDMSIIGYDIDSVELTELVGTTSNNSSAITNIVAIKESDLECSTLQHNTSNGMFRALSLLIKVNFLVLSNKPSTILIDDIGEGLDFDRSTSLINLIINKATNNKFQLIMSTNDRFVMNEVKLKYWNIISREGHECDVINNANSPKLFENFKFTGLNNFDFLKTEFYKNKDYYH